MDVLSIGCGIGGLSVALKLDPRLDVLVTSKSAREETNTYRAQGGIAAAVDDDDSPELHFRDTIRAGAGLCDEAAVRALVTEGPDRVRELIELGVNFDRNDGSLSLTREGAHSARRILHANGDATGRAVMEQLFRAAASRENITVRSGMLCVDLVLSEHGCEGALFLDTRHEPVLVRASHTVLASGGIGELYRESTNSPTATGDGYAMAYRAGATLSDMEFVQFHPTVFRTAQGHYFLISEAVRGEGGILRNALNEPFMVSYHELGDLAPRDVVSRAIVAELSRTGTDTVYLDMTGLCTDLVRERFPTIRETCLESGLDITQEPIPVLPAAHYIMGGVLVDLLGRSDVARLYVNGETACTGVHGANRLASNSLLEALVFGHRIAHDISERFSGAPSERNGELHLARGVGEGNPTRPEKSSEMRSSIKAIMTEHFGIVRSISGMQQGLEVLTTLTSELSGSVPPARGDGSKGLCRELLEAGNMAETGRIVAESALRRRESCGAHFCADFPPREAGDRSLAHTTMRRGEHLGG